MSASCDEGEPRPGAATEGRHPEARSLAHKLKALMADRRDARGRPYVSRTLSRAVDDLPDPPASASFALIAKLAGGQQDNPTVKTVLALCRALGDVPPAHLLPHPGYDDLAALEAFEDPLARRVLVLLDELPESEVRALVAQLEHRRDVLGLPPVPDGGPDGGPGRVPEDRPDDRPTGGKPKRARRRRTETEAAQYAADALEGL
ncbi:hypothetical protein [Streptomyces sp. NBC_00525]|uniref:hypothetical protein n=1 Tax=Streptomyces sp. NBC_00525 TaxID=2903660 RepID=UPI002E81E197|nr:hypothetical protein [Streptomyces sp. NBC_00525]WUC96866.1 hypothetical protein OG710_26090 [Streptomyces sp. NBC_00525]